MINLNLLSPAQKSNLRVRVIYSMIEQGMIILVALILLVTVGLLSLKIRLTGILNEVSDRQLLSAEYATANSDIKNLNAAVGRVERLQATFTPTSRLLSDLIGRTPRGVTLGNMMFETKTGALTVAGHASTRDALLEFEAALRGSPYVKQLDSQLSNLFQRTNITFQLKAVLDPVAIRKSLDPSTTAPTP